MIALSFPELVKMILSEGHEVELHAWDHRRWQDEMPSRSYGWIEDWFAKGISAYRSVTGQKPAAFGAPAWLIDERTLEIAGRQALHYLSCTRAKKPFLHDISQLPEIPSDLPCFEEIGVEQGAARLLRIVKAGGLHVLPVHAETEGGIWDAYFIEFLRETQKLDLTFLTLLQIRDILNPETLPMRRFRMDLLPGRSTPCAV
jgi:peptidoglycan/xylan/chitin deacetylase (PgdA/CDA1 family)